MIVIEEQGLDDSVIESGNLSECTRIRQVDVHPMIADQKLLLKYIQGGGLNGELLHREEWISPRLRGHDNRSLFTLSDRHMLFGGQKSDCGAVF